MARNSDIKERDPRNIRKGRMRTQIEALLKVTEEPDTRKLITDFFLRDVSDYVNGIQRIQSSLSSDKTYSEDEQERLDCLNGQILLQGFSLNQSVSDKVIMKHVKDHFRKCVGEWAYQSLIVRRAYEKPRGYPGDYRMLEIVYDNEPISTEENIGLYYDINFLKSSYAVAVRIRKDRLREILYDYINGTSLNRKD